MIRRITIILFANVIAFTIFTTSLLGGDYATPADEAAKRALTKLTWVCDLYVFSGHMNVGVLRSEKDWNSPMIGKWVCGVLAQQGSSLTWVRFVDIEAVVNKGKSPNQAEIAKFECKKQ